MNRCVSAVAALAFMIVLTGVDAQDTDWNRYTLRDLGGVFVRIEANEVCEDAGLSASAFEASTSLRLIEAEVGVLTREEMLENPALPELRVSLDCASGPDGSMAYSVALRVQQSAQMLRDAQVTLAEAVTWYSTRIGLTDASNASSSLEEALRDELDEFAEAWAAANADEEGTR